MGDLLSQEGINLTKSYEKLLQHLGEDTDSKLVRNIFTRAKTAIEEPRILRKLVIEIDQLDWFSEHRDNFGDLYEGLLQKNAEAIRSGTVFHTAIAD